MYVGQQQDRAKPSPARNSTPMDQPQRKLVGRPLSGNMERPGVVGWQIEVVAVL